MHILSDSNFNIHYLEIKTKPARPPRIESGSGPILTHKGRGLTETFIEGDADVGSKPASDFIALAG